MPFELRCRWLRTPQRHRRRIHHTKCNLTLMPFININLLHDSAVLCVSRVAIHPFHSFQRLEDRIPLLACLFSYFSAVVCRCIGCSASNRFRFDSMWSASASREAMMKDTLFDEFIRVHNNRAKCEKKYCNKCRVYSARTHVDGNNNDNNRCEITFRHFSRLIRNSLRSIDAIIKLSLEFRHYAEQIETPPTELFALFALSVPSKWLPFHYECSFCSSVRNQQKANRKRCSASTSIGLRHRRRCQ